MPRVTPVRKQYLEIKKQHPDAIVFFRLGDFYETFDEDARIAARELDIVLTSRNVAKGQRVPMAGVPYHAAESYIAKLIARGHKVAVCEQVSDEPIKGLMARQVTRVVTPGTVVEPALLEDKRNNYLAAVAVEGNRAGIAYADITTGDFATTQLQGDHINQAVSQEIARLQPAELLIADGASAPAFPPGSPAPSVTPFDAWRFELGNARRALLDYFEVANLAGFGCQRLPLAVCAAGAVLQYLQETQKGNIGQITGLSTYSVQSFMTLDAATRRNLELAQTIRTGSVKGSLLGVLDRTVTPMGGRLLRTWLSQPLLDLTQLKRRQDAVEALYNDTPMRAELMALLKELADVERLVNRVVGNSARPRDLVGIRKSLEIVSALAQLFTEWGLTSTDHPLSDLAARLDPCTDVTTLLTQAIAEEPPATMGTPGVIAPGFSAELDGITAAARDAKEWIAGLERRERRRTGVKSLKVGYNKVFGYYIEVTKANLEGVPDDYIRKQTLVNAERFITPELKEYESLVLNAEERISDLETRIFRQVCDQVAAAAPRLLATARALAELDVYAALAEVALRNNYVRPKLTDGDDIYIVAGRHPVVELTLREEPFVPNDALISDGEIIILTGPNMSGKSTWLRQVALIVLMAQIGSFVPADEATIGLVDRIFTRIGAQDEIAAGQSTFMVEMVETANILHHATDKSLLILDEIGRGTSTYDGISIAWATVEHIHNHPRLRAKTLFATHYHELTELAELLPRVHNYNVAVSEEGDDVVFLHRIVPGGADRSYGIHVARLAGLPRAVIHRAEEILEQLERDAARAPGREARRVWEAMQLSLLPPETDPLVEEIKQLDVTSMTPLEAINKLYELAERARRTQG